MIQTGVMHVIDTLNAGGAERVAINICNLLPRDRYRSFLCNTRSDGGLADLVASDVGRLRLERKGRYDAKAVWHLVSFIKKHNIRLLHAHGTSLFIAAIASLCPPYPAIVWHVHFGRHAKENRKAWLYRLAGIRVKGIVAVSQPLAEWSGRRLRMARERVSYLPNFVSQAESSRKAVDLPGRSPERIVCVANVRSEKDHLTLIKAMALVVRQAPNAHLLLVGATTDSKYVELVHREIKQNRLAQSVSILGHRHDVPGILRECDIAVLSSASEGFPLALIEYGVAKLPVVATSVGQCVEILDAGQAGILVPTHAPAELATGLLALINSPKLRETLGEEFQRRVKRLYNSDSGIRQICRLYDSIVDKNGSR